MKLLYLMKGMLDCEVTTQKWEDPKKKEKRIVAGRGSVKKEYQGERREQKTEYFMLNFKMSFFVAVCSDILPGCKTTSVTSKPPIKSGPDPALRRQYFQVYRTDSRMDKRRPIPTVIEGDTLGFHYYANMC